MKILEKNVKIPLSVNLLNGTKYENYALKNQILDKNNTFIEKKTGNSKFSFAFVYKDLIYRCLDKL